LINIAKEGIVVIVVNHRKNIVKAYHQEIRRLKQLKAYKSYNESDWKDNQQMIAQSESRLKLLKDMQQPLKNYYDL
jgi:hypothetical protein